MISAIVLAAGQSRRMGQPKINLAWGISTILGHILMVLDRAGIEEIIVVWGKVEPKNLPENLAASIKLANNPWTDQTEMLTSLQIGMKQLDPVSQAFLVVLGDQPQIQVEVVQALISKFRELEADLIVPSYQMHRGHPWLVGRSLWDALSALSQEQTLRSFLSERDSCINYLTTNTDTILKDIDTPEDYHSEKPQEE